MVVPVGNRDEQNLVKVVNGADGYATRTLTACRFVPLIAEDAWPDEGAARQCCKRLHPLNILNGRLEFAYSR